MISQELVQGLLLSFLSWYHNESDVFKVACRLTQTMYPQYAETFCIDSVPNEKVQQEIATTIYYPDTSPPFPGILLVSGSSPATSDSMMERKAFFVEKGFAVMILDSFTPVRVLEDCFRNAAPCITYQEASGRCANHTITSFGACPALTKQTDEELTSSMFKSYLGRVAVGGTLPPAKRTHDLFEALRIFRRDKNVDSTNLAMVGYSHGGSTILEALTLVENKVPPPGDERFSLEKHSLEGVRAAVVYYPCCRPGTYFQWHAATSNMPVQIHLADRDEYVKPELCSSVISKINNAEWSGKIQTWNYDEMHAFDMKEYGHAYNEQSKNLAYQRTLEFLQSLLLL